jgi:cobalt/nickel transport system permease protein
MHLPDGILDARTAAISAGAAAIGLSLALRQVRTLEPRRVPLLGLSAAFVFAAQMLNFPVLGGTSGHVIGGVLAAILLGPAAAVVVMTCVLIVQALMFSDGGVLALGANIFNMAIVSACGGYLVFRLARKLVSGNERRSAVFAAAVAGWCGTVLASISCAGQLAWSNTVPWGLAFPAMANIHMLIGLGEGLATALVVLAVLKARPDLVSGIRTEPGTKGRLSGYIVLVVIGLLVFVAPFASPLPDGLEMVARQLGFDHRSMAFPGAPMPDYQVPFLGLAAASTLVAGLVGVLIVFGLSYLLARVLVPAIQHPVKDACAGK